MTVESSDVLWLSVSPHLKCFDQRLLARLVNPAETVRPVIRPAIRRWEYCQTVDEPCCIDTVVDTLHDYLRDRIALEKSAGNAHHKVHLIGHGVSGVVGLFYARRYPQHVASLTLLSVGVLPAVNWQAHYYALRKRLPCSREIILAKLSQRLFGQQPHRLSKALVKLLARDLDSNLTLHSLANHTKILPGGVEVPLLVCNGDRDLITCTEQQSQWHEWMKPGDHLWKCPDGNHFFHFHQATPVANQIAKFWAQVQTRNPSTLPVHQSCTPCHDSKPRL